MKVNLKISIKGHKSSPFRYTAVGSHLENRGPTWIVQLFFSSIFRDTDYTRANAKSALSLHIDGVFFVQVKRELRQHFKPDCQLCYCLVVLSSCHT